MADVIRWDPFRELQSMRDTMDQLFDRGFSRPWRLMGFENGRAGSFPVDLLETEEDVVVKASLPGVQPEDVNISVTGDTLTIKGEASSETEEKQANYYRQERHFGSFQRAFTLPAKVEADKADATFEHGVLHLRLPKAQDVRPKTIEVKPKAVAEGQTS